MTDPKTFPPDVKEIHEELSQEVSWLHAQWGLYCELFATSQETLALLNEAAGGFFHLVQKSLFSTVVLGICRLTDSAIQITAKNRNENLSLHRLVLVLDRPEHHALCAEVSKMLEDSQSAWKAMRTLRHKQLAHSDLPTHRGTLPLPPITKNQIDEALAAIASIMNRIDVHFLESETAYGYPIYMGGAPALIRVIRDGLDARKNAVALRRACVPMDEK